MINEALILEYLGKWSIIGFILMCILPKPKTKRGAYITMLVCGPFVWILSTPIFIIRYIFIKHNKRKSMQKEVV